MLPNVRRVPLLFPPPLLAVDMALARASSCQLVPDKTSRACLRLP